MARYRALAPLFLRRLIAAGEEFESDLPPGRSWEPLDEEAREAVARYRSENAAALEKAERIDPRPPAISTVEIPADWQHMTRAKRRGLAMRLGAQSTVTAENADSFIMAELERRGRNAA